MGLLDWFMSKPKPQQPQGGLLDQAAAQAASALTNRQAYLDHVETETSNGRAPLKYDEWLKRQQAPKK